jgi:TetR/AcrR family transcriptional repressor of lmrAB and yxaGH operons
MSVGEKGERARARLAGAAAVLLQRQGYHGTGLADIVALSGAPRGSVYFHFPGGKEELAVVALQTSGAEWRQRLEEVIDGAPDLGAAVTAVCKVLADELEASDFAHGCPLATVALEASATSEPVRATVAAHYQGWIDAIAQRLVAAGSAEAWARTVAGFALAAIEGGLLLAKVQRSTQPLRDVGAVLEALVAVPRRPNRVA